MTQINEYKIEKQNVIFDLNGKSNGRMTHGPDTMRLSFFSFTQQN